ncbi:Low affinity immunoglobulin epsilon Fc receptor isoform X2 [Oopsacas minuta]|uniref:Low affinity immunoglobulin epsilon Fc receptor isoform X2 n=1 Tax=Oopsacas minuta TaxID=111878 RepID=A0AAV7JP44_9METZ|nr:Low affinity immunoglobulin epsilon Fc receptor isoform X2 [Oopsacas minuta]
MKTNIIFGFLLILLLQVAPVHLQVPTQGCSRIYNGEKCFNYRYTGGDWNQAKAACATDEETIASVTSSRENDLIYDKMIEESVTNCWIGLSDQFTENVFFWEDGSPVNYTNWGFGQPREESGNEDCAQITGNSKWFDVPCGDTIGCHFCSSPVSPFGVMYATGESEALPDDSIFTENAQLYCVSELLSGLPSITWSYVDLGGEITDIGEFTADTRGVDTETLDITAPGFYMCSVTQEGGIERIYTVALLEPAIYPVDPFGQAIGSYLFQPLAENTVFTVSTTLYCVTNTIHTQQTVWKYTNLDSISTYLDSDTGSSTGVSVLRASITNPGSYSCIVTLNDGSEQIYTVGLFPRTYQVLKEGCDIITENGKCLEKNIGATSIDRAEAQSNCEGKGFNLASISSHAEQLFIDSFTTTPTKCWIGLDTIDNSDVYSWIDGSSITYLNWDETLSFSGDCAYTEDGVWIDLFCEANTFGCHHCSTQVSQFGKLVDADRYTVVEDNSILTATTMLQCITEDTKTIVRQFKHISGQPPDSPPPSTTPPLGTETVEINIGSPGYYSCEVFQDDDVQKVYTVALLDPSIHTVAEASNSYTYTIDIDRGEAFLFCHKWDNSVPFEDYKWRKSGATFVRENPLSLNSFFVNQNSYQMECFDTSSGTVIHDVDILIQGPPVITLDTGVITTYDLLPGAVNEVYVNLQSPDLVLSMNIVGKWQKPDGSYVTERDITFENFGLSDAGLYRYYVTNLEMEQTLAIQILVKIYQFGMKLSPFIYEPLEDNSLVTDYTEFYCMSGYPQIPVRWFLTRDGIREDVTYDAGIDDVGVSIFATNVGNPVLYVTCESVQADGSIMRHTIWFVDTGETTVVEASDSYTYTQDIDSEYSSLLCHKADNSVPFEYTIWRELGTNYEMENPLYINNLEIDGKKHKMQCLDSRNNEEILIIDLILQSPRALTLDSGSVTTYFDPSISSQINYKTPNVTISADLFGTWKLPDDSYVTESSITIPSFEVYNEGIYEFYVTTWDKQSNLVFDITLRVYPFGQKIQDTYTNLVTETILTTSTILYCKAPLTSTLEWNYKETTSSTNTRTAADVDPVTGISLFEVSIEDSGIYYCVDNFVDDTGLYIYNIGVFDPSRYTVIGESTDFTYTTGVDSDNTFLFCSQDGFELFAFRILIGPSNTPDSNPINIGSISSNDMFVEIKCDYLASTTYRAIVYKQGPPVITLDTGSPINYEDLIPDINTAYLQVNEQAMLSVNLMVGRWQLPDGSFIEDTTITFPTFETSNQGLYKFFVISWENEHKLAIQILLKVYPFGEIDASNTHQSIEDNSILISSKTLYCITETSVYNPQVSWSYTDLDNYCTSRPSETDPITGISYLSISTEESGYYSCVVAQDSGTITTHIIALLDPSVYTVAESSSTYKYTEGVDSEETSLFCHKSDNTAEFRDVFWRERGTTDVSRNPMHIGGLAAYRNEYFAECIDSSNNQTILVVDIMLQGPPVITFDDGTVEYLTSLFPDQNSAYVKLNSKVALTANIVGRWKTVDGTFLPENSPITVNEFDFLDQGLHEFRVIDWKGNEVIAFQIYIRVHEFGALTPSSIILEDYSIITTDSEVYCTSQKPPIWRYQDFDGDEETNDVRAPLRSFSIAVSQYHSCDVIQSRRITTYTFVLLDPSIYTVVEAAESLTYTVKIDRMIAFLFCHKPDNSVPFGEIGWREMDTDERKQNPLNIADIPDDGHIHTMECLDALDDTPIFNVHILIQGPPVITLNAGSVVSYPLLPGDTNSAYLDLLSQNVVLSVNLVGRWRLPDYSWVTASSITFPTFLLSDQGLYEFYVKDLDNVETLAIQIDLTVNQFGEKIDSTTYGLLSTNSILTANTDLYCLNGAVTWSYRDLAGSSTTAKTGTIDATTGANVLSVDIDNPGYYSCEVTQQPDGISNTYTVAILDTTLLQVIETSESYLYTLGVDNDIFLFCHTPDNSISSADMVWMKSESFPIFKNPLDVLEVGNLFKYTDTYLMECLDQTCSDNILSAEISMQGPPVISVDTGTVQTFESLTSNGNTAYIIVETQNVVMTANLVGKWQRPDDTHIPDNSISFLSFDESDVGVYKFYVTDWYNKQKLAIQIQLSLSPTYSQAVTNLTAVTSSDTSILVTWGLLAEQTPLSDEKFSIYYGYDDVYYLAGTTESLYFSITGLTLNFNYTIRVDLQFAYSTVTYSETVYHSLMPVVLSTPAAFQSDSLAFLTQEKFLIAIIVLLLLIIIGLFITACLSAFCVKRYLSKKARNANPSKVDENETYALEKIPDN